MLKFITGNNDKFTEVSRILAPIKVKQIRLGLDEIQDLDADKIIRHKLKEALKHQSGPFIVEDASLYFDCFKGKLPGPFIKFYYRVLGNKGLVEMAKKMGNNKIHELVLMAYVAGPNKVKFFSGTVRGQIVEPKGKNNFGFDPIFKPNGSKKTFAQMTPTEKHLISARGLATRKLKNYLLKQL